jgi:hypothetical protein
MVARLFCEAIESVDKAEMVKKADQAVEKEVKKVVGEQAGSLAICTPCVLTACTGWLSNKTVLFDATVPIPVLHCSSFVGTTSTGFGSDVAANQRPF